MTLREDVDGVYAGGGEGADEIVRAPVSSDIGDEFAGVEIEVDLSEW